MDNGPQFEHHQRFCHLFSIFKLTCCKCVALKKTLPLILFKIITVSRPSSYLRLFQGETGGGTILMPKILNFLLLLDVNPSKKLSLPLFFMSHQVPPLIVDHILEYISNSFQTNFIKHFACGAHFQFHSNNLFEKVRWNRLPEYKTASRRIISHKYTLCILSLTKNAPLL